MPFMNSTILFLAQRLPCHSGTVAHHEHRSLNVPPLTTIGRLAFHVKDMDCSTSGLVKRRRTNLSFLYRSILWFSLSDCLQNATVHLKLCHKSHKAGFVFGPISSVYGIFHRRGEINLHCFLWVKSVT